MDVWMYAWMYVCFDFGESLFIHTGRFQVPHPHSRRAIDIVQIPSSMEVFPRSATRRMAPLKERRRTLVNECVHECMNE